MKVVVHDFGGYPFAIELSRELARHGYDVLHLYCGDGGGPCSDLSVGLTDPPNLTIRAITLGHPFRRYSWIKRLADEYRYGRLAVDHVQDWDPRVVVSANAPLVSQLALLRFTRKRRRRFIYWFQDSYGLGVRRVLARRSKLLGTLVGWPFIQLEKRMLSESDQVVAISRSMADTAASWGADPHRVHVIPNWSPATNVQEHKAQAWKESVGLAEAQIVLYAGTLGLKHDVSLLVDLAAGLDDEAVVVVISEGSGRDRLAEERERLGLQNLLLMDYLPNDKFPAALASASILVALLQEDAGSFSVPSKVYTYLGAGRPVVAAIPSENEAARTISASGAGICVGPKDSPALLSAVRCLLADEATAKEIGRRGQQYAANHFTVGPIADQFSSLMGRPRATTRYQSLPWRTIAATLKAIWAHSGGPYGRTGALARYFAWQMWQRITGKPWTVRLTPNRRIHCLPHSPVTSGILYTGLSGHPEMQFLMDYLRAGDIFLDIGANVGVYSLLASSIDGVQTHAVEPSTESFVGLQNNIELNRMSHRITAWQCAVGDQPGQVWLATGHGAMNAIVAPKSTEAEPVEMVTIDALVSRNSLNSISVIKIDIEGYELDALKGSIVTLTGWRPVLIVEVNDPDRLNVFAVEHGYSVVRYDVHARVLLPSSIHDNDGGNVILVPDVDSATKRLAS